MIEGLQQVNADLGVFSDIRGHGLLLGCELIPALEGRARDVIHAGVDAGLLLLVAGPSTLRLAPPLNISRVDIEQGLDSLRLALGRMV